MYQINCFMIFIGLALASEVVDVVIKPAHTTNFGVNMPLEQTKILNDMSWGLRLALIKDYRTKNNENTIEEGGRPVHVQALVLPAAATLNRNRPIARQGAECDPAEEAENDDNNMKRKLFRLMYETVRDSDLKVKRAELIKKYYSNSSSFEVGYLLGDVTDKFNIMSDISLTLKRLYHEWKPIEHINAYEQIANLGIDIGHIVDIVKGVEKHTTTKNESQGVVVGDVGKYLVEDSFLKAV